MFRIRELDYLKGVLILLVITFHLVWFEQLHPDVKQVVYCFHMPGFLFISGYLMNFGKEPRQFWRTMLWLAVPYLVMESGYIYLASLLPIREHIEQLTPRVFLDRLLLHPLGPYWYLHTLMLCGATYYLIRSRLGARGDEADASLRLSPEGGTVRGIFWTLMAYLIFSRALGLMTFSSALYFLAGAILRQSGIPFVRFFLPSRLSIVAFALLACFSESPTQGSLSGALIAYFAISSLLSLYNHLPHKLRTGSVFLGSNSLPLYVFSPCFTVVCKQFVPYVQSDPSGLLFLCISLPFCVGGSLLIAWAMDIVGVSRYFFGKSAIRQ